MRTSDDHIVLPCLKINVFPFTSRQLSVSLPVSIAAQKCESFGTLPDGVIPDDRNGKACSHPNVLDAVWGQHREREN